MKSNEERKENRWAEEGKESKVQEEERRRRRKRKDDFQINVRAKEVGKQTEKRGRVMKEGKREE